MTEQPPTSGEPEGTTPAPSEPRPEAPETVGGAAPTMERALPVEDGAATEPVAAEPVEPGPVALADGSVPRTGDRSPARILGYLLALAAGALLTVGVLAATGSIAGLGAGASPSPSPSPSVAPDASPAYEDGRTLGDPNAPVTIEIWADFQCPYCDLQARGVQPTIERTYAATGRASVRYRDYAFLGQESVDAAVAARCADRQGSFWYMHDLLFASQQGENQGAFARDRLLGLARFAGLEETAFTACLDDATVAAEVRAEKAEGDSLLTVQPSVAGASPQLPSTPTIRIVGPGGIQIVKGLQPFSSVEAAFDLAAVPHPSPSPGASPSGPGTSPSTAPTASPSGAAPSPSP